MHGIRYMTDAPGARADVGRRHRLAGAL